MGTDTKYRLSINQRKFFIMKLIKCFTNTHKLYSKYNDTIRKEKRIWKGEINHKQRDN